MSCPDWRSLLAHRFDRGLPEPAGWEEARTHLAACDECARRALALDPSLLFVLRAGAVEVDEGGPQAMREAVDAMRRARRVGESVVRRDRLRRGQARRWAAAGVAVVALGAGAVGILTGHEPPQPGRSGTFAAAKPAPSMEPSMEKGVPAGAGFFTTAGSVVEGVNRPNARLYEMAQGGFTVVMIVDDSLDV